MYLPPLFAEDRLDVIHAAIRQAGLATLVTFGADGLAASHVPLLLDPAPTPYGTLLGHLARANPQWQQASADVQALAIVQGPDAYVSPSWYPTRGDTGRVVPTWNYVAIHAYGTVRFFEERERLLDLVTRLTERHEAALPEPWSVQDAPADYLHGMLGGIVGFELPIARLEGKWKMSQNRPAADRAGVVEGLTRVGDPTALAVAHLVESASRDTLSPA